MRLKPAAHSPEAGAYAGLQAPVLAGAGAGREPRRLSEKQRAGFLGTAAERVVQEARERGRRWLRRMDKHESGCRTKQQRWDALAALAEPLLARVDLATLALGWLDAKGKFRLNRQRGLAEDTGLSECRVSRTLSTLEKAGYVRRRVRRIFHNGKQWITRVTIHLRPRFFIDLGLGHQLAEARTRKKARREATLREAARQQQTEALQELADAQMRRQSHRKAQAVREAKAECVRQERNFGQERAYTLAYVELCQAGMPPDEARALARQRYPMA